MERDKAWEVSLLQDSFQRCLSFVFFCVIAKATCRLQAFHLSEVQGNRIDIYNRNVVLKEKKGQISSSIKYGHENLAK